MAKSKANEWLEEDKLTLLEAWARDGLTDEQIAKNMGIATSTFYEWKNKYSELSESLKKNKEIVDIEVENALHKKAMGYNIPIKKAFKVKETLYENGKKIKEIEKIEYATEEMHIPADTTAQIFWLKNRKPKEWREKQSFDDNEELSKLDKLLEEQKNAYMDN